MNDDFETLDKAMREVEAKIEQASSAAELLELYARQTSILKAMFNELEKGL